MPNRDTQLKITLALLFVALIVLFVTGAPLKAYGAVIPLMVILAASQNRRLSAHFVRRDLTGSPQPLRLGGSMLPDSVIDLPVMLKRNTLLHLALALLFVELIVLFLTGAAPQAYGAVIPTMLVILAATQDRRLSAHFVRRDLLRNSMA